MAEPAKKKPPSQPSEEVLAQIELDYRANVLPLRQIGSKHGVSAAAVVKWADKFGWSRDLSAKIKAKADAVVNRAAVNKPVNANAAVHERETIDANAQAIASVRLSHREDIKRGRGLANKMLAELEAVTDRPDLIQALVDAMADPEEEGDAAKLYRRRLQDMVNRVVEFPARVGSLKALSETLRNLIVLERQAWGLDEDEKPDPNEGRELSDIERATRIAGVLDRARRRRAETESAAGNKTGA